MDFEGQTRIWRSGVQIKKCRYLEQSGCVGMCINMCKVWLPEQSEQCHLLNPMSVLHEHADVCSVASNSSQLSRCEYLVLGSESMEERLLYDRQAKMCTHQVVSERVKQSVRMQIPTEDFFTNQFGLPLTMNPSFEDLSCEMIFGQKAPSLQEDPIYSQPCFAHECKIGDREPTPCPKIDTERGVRQQDAP